MTEQISIKDERKYRRMPRSPVMFSHEKWNRSGISLVEGKEEVTEETGEFIRLGILGTG